jgi:hypothetical protein
VELTALGFLAALLTVKEAGLPIPVSSETALDWTDACCPACLAMAVLAPRVPTADAG